MRFFICLLFSSVFAVHSDAQVTTSQVYNFLESINMFRTAVPTLLITPDARAASMGETGVATSPDVNSIHWNAAKLAFAENKMSAGISYASTFRPLIPDIKLFYGSFYAKPDSNSAIGGSVRYFSMGNIVLVNQAGAVMGQFRPNEFAFDGTYSRKLGKTFSAALTARFIGSNLTNGISYSGQEIKAGTTFAADACGYYHNDAIRIRGEKSTLMFGMAVSNIGGKITYSNFRNREFIPMNLRLGSGIIIHPNENNQIGFHLDFNKLLIPSPPKYLIGSNGSPVVNPNTGAYVITAGKDPDVSVPRAMIQSFYDAPGGFPEELREITIGTGIEYWYKKRVAIRTGYFYESPTKGSHRFFTLGGGVKYKMLGLDFAYLFPTSGQRIALQDTFRITLHIDLDKPGRKK